MKKQLPNLIIKVTDKAQSKRAQIAFFKLGYRWVGDTPKSFYFEGDSGFISTADGLMYDDEQGGEKEVTILELETLAAEHERESKMIPNGSEFAKIIGQSDITDEQATEQPMTVSQAVYEIGQVLESCEPDKYKAIFAKMFELADPNFVRTIREALANFEGTQAVKPQSNATQVEYIDDYLDRLRGEETDFYK